MAKPPPKKLDPAVAENIRIQCKEAWEKRIMQHSTINAANNTQSWWSTPTQGRFATGSNASSGQAAHEDAPPSYEEAIGQGLPPIKGYRGSYQPQLVPEGAPRFSDEKRR